MYQVEITKTAYKHLQRIESRYQKLIAKAIDELSLHPDIGLCLKGKLKGYFKLRVAHYRILYQRFDNRLVIYIIDIGHHKDIYR
jgi:mRNA interferase RelE/StbE